MKPDVRVHVTRNLWDQRVEHLASSRQYLTEILETYAPDLAAASWQVAVSIGDRQVPPQLWDTTRAKPGQTVALTLKPPQGAGPLSTGNLFADIGLGVLFFPYGVTLLATAGLGLLQPDAPTSPTSGQPSYTLTGIRNQLAQVGQVIPFVAGKVKKVFPLHVAQPYTAWEGTTQYLHALLSPGWGPIKFEDLKIGDVAFADFVGLTYQTREGRDSDTPITLYPRVVHEALGEPNGQPIKVTNSGGPWVASVPDPDITRLEFELTWPNGLYRFGDSGKRHPMSVQVKIEYRTLPGGTYTTLFNGTITKETQNSYRQTFAVNVAANPAGYQARVTRLTADIEESRIQSDTYWTSFRGRTQDQPVGLKGLALIGIKVPASQNAQGMLDQISCTCTRYALAWNGSSWVETASANPAASYRVVAQHARANRGEVFQDSQIDLAALQTWSTHNATAGRTFGMVFADDGTMLDRLRVIASAGNASYSAIDGKLSIVEDVTQTTYVQAITPHNSRGFVKRQTFRRIPDAIRVGFMDETQDSTRQEVVAYRDGFNAASATVFDDLDLTQRGITLPQRAWEQGRLEIARQFYRRWVASQEMDLEAITARRGELISFMHPAALLGIASGRIKSTATSGGNTTSITLEGAVTMEVGKTYGVRIRSTKSDGSPQLVEIAVSAVVGRRTSLNFTSPVALSTINIAAGDLYQFGETSKVAVDCVIKSITPTGPRTATVEVTPHGQPNINNSISGPMGPYDPKTTLPQGQPKAPPKPSIVTIRRGDLTLPGDPYPVRMINLTAVVTAAPAKATPAGWFDARFRVQGNEDWQSTGATFTGLEINFLVPWGAIYEVEVRAGATAAGVGIASDWSNPVTVDCVTTPATIVDTVNVTGLELFGQGNDYNFTGTDAHFDWRMTSWSGPAEIGEEAGGGDATFLDPTFSHWRIAIYSSNNTNELRREERCTAPDYVYSYDKNYADAERLLPADPFEALARQFTAQVWVVDKYGRQSPAPARITVQNPAPALPSGLSISVNVGLIYASFNQPTDPDWMGMKVWASTTDPNFTPNDATNLLGKVNACIASFNEFQSTHAPVLSGQQYFVKIAAYDAFGDDPALLNISGSIAVTTDTIDLAALPQFVFDPEPVYTTTLGTTDSLSWTASTAKVTDPDTSVTTIYAVQAGSVTWGGAVIYVSYRDKATSLEASTDPAHHATVDRVLMAVWRGGRDLKANNGKALIDGSQIYAQTITAAAIATGVAVITQAAQIASAIITNAKIVDLDVNKLIAGTILAKLIYLGASAGGRIELDGGNNRIRVFDNQATPRLRVEMGKLGVNPADWGLTVYGQGGGVLLDSSGLDGTFIRDLTVDSIKIKDGAISSEVLVTGGSLAGVEGTPTNFLSATITVVAGKRVRIQLSTQISCSGVATGRLLRNGTLLKTFNYSGGGLNDTFGGIWVDASAPAGSVGYQWTWSASTATPVTASGGVMFLEQILK